MAKETKATGVAYLVIRDGTKWSDVFRLIPGRTITIGRSPTCQIVVREEQASRQHAELFVNNGSWVIRDLDSRNGTAIGETRVFGDNSLTPGDVIWIAKTQMAFVTDLSAAYGNGAQQLGDAKTLAGLEVDEAPTVALGAEPTTITHRKFRTKFHSPESVEEEEVGPVPKVGQAAAKLCRLAFELANEKTMAGISELAVKGVIESTQADACGILMIPRNMGKRIDAEKLEIVAWQADEPLAPYQRVSQFLAETVISEGEAVLARDIADDSALGIRDSKGEIQATSVICAPIKVAERTVGLVHLYSTENVRPLDADDLDFTLAVAENVALAMKNRFREQKLVEDLTKTKTEITQLRQKLGVESEIVGASPAMLLIDKQIAQAAPSNATVLVYGESGVGKELVARAVHYSSARRKGPFVCINCAALSESLLESELFGHERGAFTGATERKIGKFEAADKGTLMLDEIGEMSPSIQAKFLRVLEGHAFERVGGAKPIKADVRVISATNRDLEQHVRDGGFRKDLFFRLNVIKIEVPALRKRVEDIVPLAEHFLQKFNADTARKISGFSNRALNMLQTYRWPGNVRELKNVVERAVVLAQGDIIDVDDLTLSSLTTASESRMEFLVANEPFEPTSLAEMERKHILSTLMALSWNKSRTAQVLGIERSTLDRKIKRYDLERLKPD